LTELLVNCDPVQGVLTQSILGRYVTSAYICH